MAISKVGVFGPLLCILAVLSSARSGRAGIKRPVHLCCPSHYYYNRSSYSCIRSPDNLYPTIYDEAGNPEENGTSIINITSFVTCESYFLEEPAVKLINNGFLGLTGTDYDDTTTLIPPGDFCLLWMSPEENSPLGALICFPDESDTNYVMVMDRYVIPTLMGISAVFLAATFIIYWCIRETHDLLTKSFMCSIAMLCLSKVSGVITIVVASADISLGFCIAIGITTHIAFLSAFFWLNAISFIVFSSIWSRGKSRQSCMKGRCFVINCFYGFGSPLVILILIILRDMTDTLDKLGVPQPGFGDSSCGFSNRGSQFVFFYAPIAVLLGMNLILFCLSAFKLCSQKTTATLFQFYHHLKLLLLMGIPWIFEVLSFFFMDKYVLSPQTVIWYIFDVLNASQGIFIFLAFVCTRKILPRALAICCCKSFAKRRYPDEFRDKDDNPTEALTQDFKIMEEQEQQDQD